MHTAGGNIQSGKGTLHRRYTELARLSTQPALSLRPVTFRIWPVTSITRVYSTFTLFERIPTLTKTFTKIESLTLNSWYPELYGLCPLLCSSVMQHLLVFKLALAIVMTRDRKMARTEAESGGERPE